MPQVGEDKGESHFSRTSSNYIFNHSPIGISIRSGHHFNALSLKSFAVLQRYHYLPASYSIVSTEPLISCILFDLGDTLIHLDKPTAEVVKSRLRALHRTLTDDGFDVGYARLDEIYSAVHSEQSLFSQETGIETTTNRILEEVLARLGIKPYESRTTNELVQSFFEPEIKSWILYDDAISVLSYLKNQGFSLGLVSNARSHWAVVEIMRRLEIDGFFGTTITSARFGLRKPRPEIYLKAMCNLSSHPGSTIMIGDSLENDVKGAKRLKTRALYLEREILDQTPVEPDATVRSLSDVLGIIAEWKES